MVTNDYKSKYAGVHCDIYYIDEPPTDSHSVYISFGDFDPDSGEAHDSNGVPDGMVFYYTENEEWDIMRHGQNVGTDFMVIPDSIEYDELETA